MDILADRRIEQVAVPGGAGDLVGGTAPQQDRVAARGAVQPRPANGGRDGGRIGLVQAYHDVTVVPARLQPRLIERERGEDQARPAQ